MRALGLLRVRLVMTDNLAGAAAFRLHETWLEWANHGRGLFDGTTGRRPLSKAVEHTQVVGVTTVIGGEFAGELRDIWRICWEHKAGCEERAATAHVKSIIQAAD
jgi:hypothetical protein